MPECLTVLTTLQSSRGELLRISDSFVWNWISNGPVRSRAVHKLHTSMLLASTEAIHVRYHYYYTTTLMLEILILEDCPAAFFSSSPEPISVATTTVSNRHEPPHSHDKPINKRSPFPNLQSDILIYPLSRENHHGPDPTSDVVLSGYNRESTRKVYEVSLYGAVSRSRQSTPHSRPLYDLGHGMKSHASLSPT
ncbi:hypothetical protein BDV12DRAFT_83966 [Aspergillus spectabilis]